MLRNLLGTTLLALTLAASLGLTQPAAAAANEKPIYQVLIRKAGGNWMSGGMTSDAKQAGRIIDQMKTLGYVTCYRILTASTLNTPLPNKVQPPASRPQPPASTMRPPVTNNRPAPLVGTWTIQVRTDARIGQEFTMEITRLQGSTFTFRVPYHGQGQGTYDARTGAIRFSHNGRPYSGNVRPSTHAGGWYMGGFIATGAMFPPDWTGHRR